MLLHVQGQQRLVDNSPFIHGLVDGLAHLRAAAIATEHFVHVFDMDATPPVCHVFPPLETVFKAKGTYGRDNGSSKALQVPGSAWSPILGKDVLPKELQLSDMYARNKLAVLLKLNSTYHSCVKQSGQAAVPPADLKKLALTFMKVTYDKGKQPKQPKKADQAPTTGKKRGRPGELIFVDIVQLNSRGLPRQDGSVFLLA